MTWLGKGLTRLPGWEPLQAAHLSELFRGRHFYISSRRMTCRYRDQKESEKRGEKWMSSSLQVQPIERPKHFLSDPCVASVLIARVENLGLKPFTLCPGPSCLLLIYGVLLHGQKRHNGCLAAEEKPRLGEACLGCSILPARELAVYSSMSSPGCTRTGAHIHCAVAIARWSPRVFLSSIPAHIHAHRFYHASSRDVSHRPSAWPDARHSVCGM